MKILIVSDTHGKESNLEKVLKKVGDIDRLIHLGDLEGGEDYIRSLADIPMDIVAGNNDYYSDLPRETVIQLGNYRALITHGHYYYVVAGLEHLIREAQGRDVDIVMFGHIHRPVIRQEGALTVINPGSLSFPRQEDRKPSYIVMETDAQKGFQYFLKFF